VGRKGKLIKERKRRVKNSKKKRASSKELESRTERMEPSDSPLSGGESFELEDDKKKEIGRSPSQYRQPQREL